jgi:ribosome biogenesis GTPase A
VGTNAVVEEEVAFYLAELLLERYPALLQARYSLSADKMAQMDGVGLVEAVAERRAYRLKGGVLDLEKAASTLLLDYRSGSMGRISLETPATRAVMLARDAEIALKREQARAAAEKARLEKAANGRRDSQSVEE